jgi:heme A synthase
VSTREQVAGDIHLVSAGLMFIFLAWMAIRFTNTDSPQSSPQKLLRNLIYKICAIVILAALVAAVITNFLPASVRAHFPWWLFLYEALAILAFGVSWFVKGQTLIGAIKDVPEEVPEPVA